MRRLRSALAALLVSVSLLAAAGQALAQKTVHVKGYTRKDGTVVKPYDRKAPSKNGTPTPTSAPAARPTATPDQIAAKAAPSDNDDTIVYVTRTGGKYHAAGCRYLRGGGTAMKLSEAAKRYQPCSVCQPPVLHSVATPGADVAAVPTSRAAVISGAPKAVINEPPPTSQGVPQVTGIYRNLDHNFAVVEQTPGEIHIRFIGNKMTFGSWDLKWDSTARVFRGGGTLLAGCGQGDTRTMSVPVDAEMSVVNASTVKSRWTHPETVDCAAKQVRSFSWKDALWFLVD